MSAERIEKIKESIIDRGEMQNSSYENTLHSRIKSDLQRTQVTPVKTVQSRAIMQN